MTSGIRGRASIRINQSAKRAGIVLTPEQKAAILEETIRLYEEGKDIYAGWRAFVASTEKKED